MPDNDPHTGLGVTYESLACGRAHLTTDKCVTDADAQAAWTADDGRQLVNGDALTIYALHRCRLIGGYASAEADALEKLANGFGRAVEEGLEAASLPTADDLTPTPGTAVHPMAGLAILEAYARATYGGVPVLHAPADVATSIHGAIDRYGPRLETKIGTYVSVGGGYGQTLVSGRTLDDDDELTAGVTAGADERWLRITGTVTIRQGTAKATAPTIGAAAPKNEMQVFAYQPVVVTTECINAAVLVQAPEVVYGADGGTP